MAAARQSQRTFDLFTGEPTNDPPPGRISTGFVTNQSQSKIPDPNASTNRRTSIVGSQIPVRATIDNENLRAKINTLTYDLSSQKQSHDVELLSLQSSLRESERRVEVEYKRALDSTTNLNAVQKKWDLLVKESKEDELRSSNVKIDLERKLRILGEENRSLQDEVEELKGVVGTVEREVSRERTDWEQKVATLDRDAERRSKDIQSQAESLRYTQSQLDAKTQKMDELENEILQLKAQTGDVDTLTVIKRELGEQVAHIKKLESSNVDLFTEAKLLRRDRKAVEVVEEEKRALQSRLIILDDVQKELAESQLQRRILEDEKMAWSTYLEGEQFGNGEHFKSPEDMARGFVGERVKTLSLLEEIGKIRPELVVRDENINALENEKVQLQAEIKQLKAKPSTDGGDSKARARLERQRNLAVKEVEYLRAQIKSLEDETTEFNTTGADSNTASSKINGLEALIDEYKVELQTLHSRITTLEDTPQLLSSINPENNLKRPASQISDTPQNGEDERLGSLRRKVRKTSDALTAMEVVNKTLNIDLAASRAQIAALKSSSKTRILALSNNPTAAHAAIKQSHLDALRAENSALLSQLSSSVSPSNVVPRESLAALELVIRDKDTELAQRDKKTLRLKQIWSAKAVEFTAAIKSTLGWDVTFLPHGKLKLSSVYYPKTTRRSKEDDDGDDGEEEENFILFDGEKGTMKISGGEKSRFAREIRDMVEFWVEGRGEVPCFLAAASLEFWERGNGSK